MDLDLDKLLARNNARFKATMKSILERYNQPFEDDVVISMETLTYHTPKGPKQWGKVTSKKIKKWRKETFKCDGGSRSNASKVNIQKKKVSEPQAKEFESGCSKVRQECPESSHVYTSFKECPEHSHVGTSYTDEESDDDIVSVRRKCDDVHFKNLHVVDGQSQGKAKVDVIVQDNTRKIPKCIKKAPQCSSEGLHLALPEQGPIGNPSVYRKKLELSNEWSSSRPLQLQFSGVPISSNAITIPRHQPSPELNKTDRDSILIECQTGGGEFWSSITLADLYPAMVELLKRLMMKQARRKELEYMFGHLRHKRWHFRRPKLNITVDKIRGFRPLKLKQALPSICSSTSEDIWNQTFESKNRELCGDKRDNLEPYSYIDTNESKIDCSDSSLERHWVCVKGPKVFRQTGFPNAMAGMEETFLAEDELKSPVLLKNSKYKESEKPTHKYSSECHFIICTSSSGSTTLHLVRETKPPINFTCGDTSALCSPTSSSYGNSNAFKFVTNSSLDRASNTFLINPEKTLAGRQISFQDKDSFSSLPMKQGPSKMPQKNQIFESLYYKLCSEEIPRPAILTRPLLNSQELEEKGRLVKRSLSTSVRSSTWYDREFDRIYEELCCEGDTKLPGFQRALNVRKYEGMQIPETVKALVKSPVRNTCAIIRSKRPGDFQNDHLCSPLKRLKNIPECHFPSTKCQQISQRKNVNLRTVGMDFLSAHNHSNPSIFDHHNCWSQNAGFHASLDKTCYSIPGTSVQESRIAYCPLWPKGSKELMGLPNICRSITKGYPEN